MHYNEAQFTETLYQPLLLNQYFDGLKIGVLDIETTGLSPDCSRLILGGLLTADADSGQMTVHQYFAEDPVQEPQVLDAFLRALTPMDVLITYNGDRFDLPFIERRLLHCGRSQSLPLFLPFDLYRIIRHHSRLREVLPNLKQKTIEAFLGLASDRTDQISGAESVQLYKQYAATKAPTLRKEILLHNSDDLLQLARLLRILDKLDLHRILFTTGFPVSCGPFRLLVRDLRLSTGRLSASGRTQALSLDYQNFQTSFEAAFRADTQSFTLSLPLLCEAGYTFADLEALQTELPDASLEDLEDDPLCESGYLILRTPQETRWGQTNRLLKKILTEILRRLC